MLLRYIQAAMSRAEFLELPDSEGFFGSIPGFAGVWANAPAVDACRAELQEVLEDWILVRVRHGLDLPTVDGIDLNVTTAEQEVA